MNSCFSPSSGPTNKYTEAGCDIWLGLLIGVPNYKLEFAEDRHILRVDGRIYRVFGFEFNAVFFVEKLFQGHRILIYPGYHNISVIGGASLDENRCIAVQNSRTLHAVALYVQGKIVSCLQGCGWKSQHPLQVFLCEQGFSRRYTA